MLMAVSLNLRLSYTGNEEVPWVWLIGCLCRSPSLGSQADSSTSTFLPSSKWGLHQRKKLPVLPPSLSLNKMCFWLGRDFVTLIIALNKQIVVVVVQSPSCVWPFASPWPAARQASLSLTVSQSLPKFMSIASVMSSHHSILWHRLLFLPSVFPNIKNFSNELAVPIRSPKYWSFSFSLSPSNEYSGLISLKIDWFDLLAVQGPPKQLPTTSKRHIYLYVSVFKYPFSLVPIIIKRHNRTSFTYILNFILKIWEYVFLSIFSYSLKKEEVILEHIMLPWYKLS